MIALLLAFLPHSELVPNRVDVIERNSFVDVTTGKVVWTQWIYRDFDGDRFVIRDWRLDRGQRLTKCGDRWRMSFVDGQRMITVEADSFQETVLDYDPELAERETTPVDKRRLLR